MEDINFRTIVLILFVVIGAIQWVGKKFKGHTENEPSQDSNSLEDIYEEYREQIRQRQTTIEPEYQEENFNSAPPPMPQAEVEAQPLIIDETPVIRAFESQKPTLTK